MDNTSPALAALEAAYVAALALARADNTQANREAVVAASAALSAAIPHRAAPRSRDMSAAARSGRRQQAALRSTWRRP